MIKLILSMSVICVVVFSCVLTWKEYITKTDNWKVLVIVLMAYFIYMVW
ncbi:hypothetical protein QE443_004681 [Pantoea ananatis]|nr:hypothetical protein [Pantoea ananatis]